MSGKRHLTTSANVLQDLSITDNARCHPPWGLLMNEDDQNKRQNDPKMFLTDQKAARCIIVNILNGVWRDLLPQAADS